MALRTKLLIVLLGAACAGAAFFIWQDRDSAPPKKSLMSNEFAQAFAAITAAEKLEAGERCLRYPDLPWLAWDRQVIEAFCHSRSFQHLQVEDIARALDAGHADLLEHEFGVYLTDNFDKPGERGILTRTYRELFWTDSAQVKDLTERWVALAPQSAFALAARGAATYSAAAAARGGEFLKDTPPESIQHMHDLAQQARADIEASLRLEPKLTAAYDTLIFVGRLIGDHAFVSKSIQMALALDPNEDRFYFDWMATSEPRWGGSSEQMEGIARAAEKGAGSNPMLRLLREKQRAYFGAMELQRYNYATALAYFDQGFAFGPSSVDLNLAGAAASSLGEHEKAIWYYSQAYRFDRFSAATNLTSRAYELTALGRSDLALADTQTVMALKSTDQATLIDQAYSLYAARRYAEAERVYREVLRLNARHEGALMYLANLYLGPLHDPQLAESVIAKLQEFYPSIAHTWYLVAMVTKGKNHEKQEQALNQYLALVDLRDPREKQCIEQARSQLDELRSARNSPSDATLRSHGADRP